MPSQHKHPPISFRPPEADRSWLLEHAASTGQPVNAILVEAIARERARQEAGTMDTGTRLSGFDRRAIARARALADAWTADSLRPITGRGAEDDGDLVRTEALGIARKLLGDLLAIIDRGDGHAAAQAAEDGAPEVIVRAWCKGCRHAALSVPCPRCGGPACAGCGRCPPCDGPVPDEEETN
jgi:hypothetical protein